MEVPDANARLCSHMRFDHTMDELSMYSKRYHIACGCPGGVFTLSKLCFFALTSAQMTSFRDLATDIHESRDV